MRSFFAGDARFTALALSVVSLFRVSMLKPSERVTLGPEIKERGINLGAG
jgi:hypothetical protein